MQANTFTFFILYWSIFTMLCWFQMYIKVNQLHILILFHILFPYRLLQHLLCCTIGPCWVSILYIVVCICFIIQANTFQKWSQFEFHFCGLQMKKSGLKYHSLRMHQFSNKPKQSLFGNYVPPWYVKTLESESSINQINYPKPNIKQ